MSVLNYVWLSNKNYYDPDTAVEKSPVPVTYLNNVITTSLLNPQTQANVWVDMTSVGEQAGSFIKHVKMPKNLSFVDLNDVPSYRDDPLFKSPKVGIWQKVDLLRLVVVDHVLKNTKASTVFYSDFDFHVPVLSTAVVQSRMDRTNWIFCHDEQKFENSFFGLHASQSPDLTEAFIPLTIRSYDLGFKNGYTAFYRCAGAVCDCGVGICVDEARITKFAIPMRTTNGPSSVGGRVVFDPSAQLMRPDQWKNMVKQIVDPEGREEKSLTPSLLSVDEGDKTQQQVAAAERLKNLAGSLWQQVKVRRKAGWSL